MINVASTAAFQPLPGTANYAATKAYVLSLSEALHSEVKDKGVTVTALCPGPVRTEFTEAAGIQAPRSRLPDMFWMSAEDVAAEAVRGADRQAGRRPGVDEPRPGRRPAQHAPTGGAATDWRGDSGESAARD